MARRRWRVSVPLARALRRGGIVVACLLTVSAAPIGLVGAIVGGHVNVPWHLPAALAIVCEPACALAALALVAALRRCAPRLAAVVDGALPCAHPARVARTRPGRMHEAADFADSLLWGVGAALWGASLCGPVFVAAFGDYLDRRRWAAAAAALAALQAAALLRVLLRSALFAHADAAAAAKKFDGDHADGGGGGGAPPPAPVSGTAVAAQLLAAHAAGGAALALLYWRMAPGKAAAVWPALLGMI